MHMLGVSCDCGVVAPDRQHHFWGCPVAQAVTQVLQEQLSPQCHLRALFLRHVVVCEENVKNLTGTVESMNEKVVQKRAIGTTVAQVH